MPSGHRACFPGEVWAPAPWCSLCPGPGWETAGLQVPVGDPPRGRCDFPGDLCPPHAGLGGATRPTPTKFKGNAGGAGILPWPPALPASPRDPEAQVRSVCLSVCLSRLRCPLSGRRAAPAGAQRHLAAPGRPCGAGAWEVSAQSPAEMLPPLPTWVVFQEARNPRRPAGRGGNAFPGQRARRPELAAFFRGHGRAARPWSWSWPGIHPGIFLAGLWDLLFHPEVFRTLRFGRAFL